MAKTEEQANEPPSADPESSIDVVEAKAPEQSVASLRGIESEIERAFENFFNRNWLRNSRFNFPALRESVHDKIPSVNVIDREDELVVEAELPDVKKEDLELAVSDNTVTIKASTRREEKEEKGDYHRQEISTRSFSRLLQLPAAVEGGKASAELKDGLLTITLPKSESTKRVKIKVD